MKKCEFISLLTGERCNTKADRNLTCNDIEFYFCKFHIEEFLLHYKITTESKDKSIILKSLKRI